MISQPERKRTRTAILHACFNAKSIGEKAISDGQIKVGRPKWQRMGQILLQTELPGDERELVVAIGVDHAPLVPGSEAVDGIVLRRVIERKSVRPAFE